MRPQQERGGSQDEQVRQSQVVKRRYQEGVRGLGFTWQRILSKQGSCEWESPGIACLGLTSEQPSTEASGGGQAGGPLTYERFDGAVDVLVLLEARGRGERLPAVGAGVSPGSYVLGADVALQVAGVGEHLGGQTPLLAPPLAQFRPLGGALSAALAPALSLSGRGLCCRGDPRMTSGEPPSLPPDSASPTIIPGGAAAGMLEARAQNAFLGPRALTHGWGQDPTAERTASGLPGLLPSCVTGRASFFPGKLKGPKDCRHLIGSARFTSMFVGRGGAGGSGRCVCMLPSRSSHIRSACRCHGTSGGG